MSLTFAFNEKYKASMISDCVLQVECNSSFLNYDFAARVMYGWGGSSISYGMVPFSQLDRETLIAMRDKLIDLGGKPPELPDESPSAQAAQRKFNL